MSTLPSSVVKELKLLLFDAPFSCPSANVDDAGSAGRRAKLAEKSDDDDDDLNPRGRPRSAEASIEVKTRAVPGVRYRNLAGYLDLIVGGDENYAIEVLMGTMNWRDEVASEIKRYQKYEAAENSMAATEIETLSGSITSGVEAFGEDFRLRRVKISSATVTRALSEFAGHHARVLRPITFPDPFLIFRDTYEQMKDRLAEMEKPVIASRGSGHSSPEHHTQVPTNPQSDPPITGGTRSTNSYEDSETSVRDMRCYIQFVETNVLPIWSSIKPCEGVGPTFVEFADLPCLFREGDLIYVPNEGLRQSAFKSVWRLGGIITTNVENFPDGSLTCDLYCLDYNGDRLVPIRLVKTLEYFQGKKDIRELACYPLSFHASPEAVEREADDMGSRFLFCVRKQAKSLVYSGWTVTRGTLGEPLRDEKGDAIEAAEYIESEIIVDFKEALRNIPRWSQQNQQQSHKPEPYIIDSRYPSDSDSSFMKSRASRVRRVSTRGQPKKVDRSLAHMYYGWNQQIGRKRKREFQKRNPVFEEGSQGIDIDGLAADDAKLLPRMILAYVLRQRKFVRLDVQGVDQSHNQRRVTLDDIQMSEAHRKILRSSVSSHLNAQSREKRGGEFGLDVDIIHGKGKGLVILLHGAPGVGKTATAEAIAMENNRPLFPISCGDLGFSSLHVEKTLRDIFRWAHLWECILLLDEADVFLTQRERGGDNLERNAIVGVFLRTLEYYNGILFLTTNRVGALDEAFRSRVHISLWYPYLSLDDTISILRSNLKRLPQWNSSKDSTRGLIKIMYKEIEDFVCREYENFSEAVQKNRGPWNGRQIRNAVQVAACLALYDREQSEDESLPAILTAEHFRTVAETTKEFENFLKVARVGDDEYLARQRQERVDDYGDRKSHNPTAGKVVYTGYKSRGNPRPPQSATRRGKPSRSVYGDDQYESQDEDRDRDIDLDYEYNQQNQERQRGKTAARRNLNEEYDAVSRARRRHTLDHYDDYEVPQSEEEEERMPSSYRGGEGTSNPTRRAREIKRGHIETPGERRQRQEGFRRY